jgi:hypothetical protein
MRRFVAPFVVVGGFVLAGCGPGAGAIAPTNIPPAPKHPPVGEKGPTDNGRTSRVAAAPVVQP